MPSLFGSAKRIRSISSKLSMESVKREHISEKALEVARDYLNSLSANDWSPEEVTLSAVYMSYKLSNEDLSKFDYNSAYSSAKLNDWLCIVEDMLTRRKISEYTGQPSRV